MFFDPNKPVCLSVDASLKGDGAAILQNDCPVVFTSIALILSNGNDMQIKKEVLANSFWLWMLPQLFAWTS